MSHIPTILQLVLMDETGDSYYRMRWPGKHLAEQHAGWRIINLDARAAERFQMALEADLLVLYQSNDLDLLPIVKKRRAQGKKTLAEYNDNFYAPPPASPVAEAWSSPLVWQAYESFMRECDGLIVTGPGLAELFKEKTAAPIHILENHFPERPEPFRKLWSEKDAAKLVIGWGGSLGHVADLFSVLTLIHELAECDRRISFHLMGNDALPAYFRLPKEQFNFTPWGSIFDYYRFWRPVHIGIAPLIETPYNICRSDVKAIEMSAMGALPLLPDLLPYRNFLQRTGSKSFRNLPDLKERILSYLERGSELEQEANRGHAYVDAGRIGVQQGDRYSLYSKMLGGRPSDYDWKLPAGYHELNGTALSSSRSQEILVNVQKCFQQKQPAQGLALLREARRENPWQPDLALAELKCLRILNDSTTQARAVEYAGAFSADLRFLIFQLEISANEDTLLQLWRTILNRLESLAEPARELYRESLCTLAGRSLSSLKGMLPITEGVLTLYPRSARLRLEMARTYHAAGNHQRALELYEWLVALGEGIAANRELYDNLELKELRCWILACKAQLLEKSSQ